MRFSLRFLFIAVAVAAALIAFVSHRLQRGWTVDKVERLITAEFDPGWDRFAVEGWLESQGFHVGGFNSFQKANDFRLLYAADGRQQRDAGDADYLICGRVGEENSANLGPVRSGDIYAFFFYDRVNKLLKYSVLTFPKDEQSMPPKPAVRESRFSSPEDYPLRKLTSGRNSQN